MAVIATKGTTKLSLSLKTGIDTSGKDIIKPMNLAKVKTTAVDDNLHATAKAIEPLLKYTVVSIEKTDSYSLNQA